MKKWSGLRLFFVFLVAATSSIFAGTGMVEGRVRDSRTHMGLPYVKVELLYTGIRVALEYTDADGRFMFANVEPRGYTLALALSGYNGVSLAVDASSQSYIEIELSKPAVFNPPAQTGSPTVSIKQYMVPEKARKEFELAEKDIQRKDCSKAIRHLENGLRLYDQYAGGQNDLGNCRRQLGDFTGAEAAFKRAIALSNEPAPTMNLAETYSAQGRFGDAEATLMEAIKKFDESGDVYYALAVNYFKQDRLNDAEAAALQADSRVHRIADLHLLLAKIYALTDPEKVVPQLELYLKEAPNGPHSKQVREAIKEAKEER
jgi:tetratricopeptide (TPR) repeat protein